MPRRARLTQGGDGSAPYTGSAASTVVRSSVYTDCGENGETCGTDVVPSIARRSSRTSTNFGSNTAGSL